MSSMTPEERDRIVEEQRLRNQEDVKMGLKILPRIFLVLVGIGLVIGLCGCAFYFGLLNTLINTLINSFQ